MDLPSSKLPQRAVRKDYAVASHYIEVDSAVTPQDALDPNFWPHLASKFRVKDEITVTPTDLSYYLTAQVVGIDPAGHWVKLRKLSLVEGGGMVTDVKDDAGYRIDHDPVQGWRILQGRDLIAKDLPDEATAKTTLANLRNRSNPPKKAAA